MENNSDDVDSDHQFSTQELIEAVGNLIPQDPGLCLVQFKEERTSEELNTSDEREELHIKTNGENEDVDIEAAQANNAEARKRKKRADPSQWNKNVIQTKRMKGESYSSQAVRKEQDGGKTKTMAVRNVRELGEPCRSTVCAKRKLFFCSEFSEDTRKEIFTNFWQGMDWNQKKSLVVSLVDSVPVHRRTAGSLEQRKETFIYCLKLNEKKVQVCRNMFLSTLGLHANQVFSWVKNSASGIPKTPPPKKLTGFGIRERAAAKSVENFLERLPKLPSHYCRSSSSKLYLEPGINSKNELFGLYKSHCLENQSFSCSRAHFYRIFDLQNVGLFTPRKDQCDVCVAYENKQLSEEEYTTHIQTKNLARNEKEMDKAMALQGKCHVLTVDLQAVMLAPRMKASSLYYKTKLIVHNYTIYNLGNKQVKCYVWNESEGDLSSSTFASCLVDYISNNLLDNLPVIIFSDGCTAQNRNVVLSNALLDLAVKSNRIIYQKYLAKGHTQMECDSVHSAIEARLRNKDVYLSSDYLGIVRSARSKLPYQVVDVDHTFFRDYSLKKFHRFSSIRPGSKTGDSKVTDLKLLKYSPDETIHFKLGYSADAWKVMPHQTKTTGVQSFPNLFHSRIKISARKYSDLQELKHVLPEHAHAFYHELLY